jgi:cytochrome c peroxidase
MAVPQIGLGTQPNGDSYGREDITHNRADRYKWRTMSLLNVAKTGPWSHDGAFTSLKAMVTHMVDPSTPYDQSNVLEPKMQNLEHTDENHAKALAQLEKNRLDGISPHRVADLSDKQIDQIVAFLESLTDPRLNDYDYMKQWVPENNDEAQTLDLQVDVTLPSEATKQN